MPRVNTLVVLVFRILMTKTTNVFTLGMIHIAQVVQSSALPDSVLVFPAYLQVSPAADDCLLELPHHLESVAKVAAGLGLAQSVPHAPGKGEVVLVVLHRLHIVSKIKVGVA